jgi:hypothetical protein
MAVIDIIGISNKEVNWKELNTLIRPLTYLYFEIFPIPKALGFEKDAIGIYLPSKKGKDAIAVQSELKKLISQLQNGFELTELYTGEMVTINSIDDLIKRIESN